MSKFIIFFVFLIITKVSISQSNLPSVKIKTIQGNELAFNSIFNANDTITIVSFWATWCGPCVKELDAFADNLEEWQKQLPVKLIGISVDDSRTASKVKTFVKGRGWDFQIYQDVNNDLKRALNIPNVPHTIVIKNGRVLFQTDGYVPGNEDEMIEKITKAIL